MLFLIWTTWLVIVGGALLCDAWTSADRLYGVTERLILVVEMAAALVKGVVRPPAVCWEKELKPGSELEGGTEGHNTLFSPLNVSGTCHTFVMDGKWKTDEKKRVRERRERAVRDFWIWVTNERYTHSQICFIYCYVILVTFVHSRQMILFYPNL